MSERLEEMLARLQGREEGQGVYVGGGALLLIVLLVILLLYL